MTAADSTVPREPELKMAIDYVLDTSLPETYAGCAERIRNMQQIIRALAAPAPPLSAQPKDKREGTLKEYLHRGGKHDCAWCRYD